MQGYVSGYWANNVKGKILHSFRVKNDQTFYNCGGTDPKVAKGDHIEFEFTDKNGRAEVSIPSIRKMDSSPKIHQGTSGAALLGVVGAAKLDRDEYWSNKEKRDVAKDAEFVVKDLRIQWQAARKDAIQITSILVENGLKLPEKNAEAAIIGKIADLTEKLFNETQKVGDPVSSSDEFAGSDAEIPH